jgi:hypothetical protein
LPVRLVDKGAIEMNDYLMLGISAGVPTLAGFLMYVTLSLTRISTREAQNYKPPITALDVSNIVCRAGALVLLISFWFDGGLFKLPTGTVFWILLELGKAESEDSNPETLNLCPESKGISEYDAA